MRYLIFWRLKLHLDCWLEYAYVSNSYETLHLIGFTFEEEDSVSKSENVRVGRCQCMDGTSSPNVFELERTDDGQFYQAVRHAIVSSRGIQSHMLNYTDTY